MRNSLVLAGVFALGVSGCATAHKVCDHVAAADDSYAAAMLYLREAGLLDACAKGLATACKAKEAVLVGQDYMYRAYTICFEDK